MSPTNLTSEPNVKAYSCKSTTSQLCSAERENWLKPVTAQRVLRIKRLRHAATIGKVRVDLLNVQSMSWSQRSYRRMLWRIVTKMREENADAIFLSDLSTPEWMSKGCKVMMLGLEEFSLFVNGTVGTVLSRLFVNMWQKSGTMTRTTESRRWMNIGASRYHLVSRCMHIADNDDTQELNHRIGQPHVRSCLSHIILISFSNLVH